MGTLLYVELRVDKPDVLDEALGLDDDEAVLLVVDSAVYTPTLIVALLVEVEVKETWAVAEPLLVCVPVSEAEFVALPVALGDDDDVGIALNVACWLKNNPADTVGSLLIVEDTEESAERVAVAVTNAVGVPSAVDEAVGEDDSVDVTVLDSVGIDDAVESGLKYSPAVTVALLLCVDETEEIDEWDADTDDSAELDAVTEGDAVNDGLLLADADDDSDTETEEELLPVFDAVDVAVDCSLDTKVAKLVREAAAVDETVPELLADEDADDDGVLSSLKINP